MTRDCELPHTFHFTILLLSLLLAFLGGAGPVLADTSHFANESQPVATQYQKAKDYYYLLLRDEQVQGERRNWLSGIREFRRIYLDHPKGEFAPNCLFMMAKMYYRMYMGFQVQSDLDESITYYNNVWTIFPDNSLADDALFWSAEIYRKDKQSPEQAAKLYTTQVKRYPDGDKYAEAASRLRELDAEHNTGLPEKLSSQNGLENLARVLPVKYWSSDDYIRIVIRSSGPVRYTSTLLDKQDGKPRRLYIDFALSAIDDKFTVPVPIQEGLLQKIHSSQLDRTTVRVALDIESIATYKIFSLNDPFRVIVDVHGPRKIIASSKTLPEVKQEQIPRTRQEPSPRSTPELAPARKKAVQTPAEGLAAVEPRETFIILDDNNKKEPGLAAGKTPVKAEPGLSLAQQLGLSVRRIVIDPGHGGKDPGAMAFGLKEKDIALKVAQKTAARLRDTYDYEVIMTREIDTSLPLEERTAIANTTKADLFISIHVNAHPKKTTRGVETFYLNLATNTEAMRVAARENATSTHNISDLQDILTDLMQNSKIQESSILAKYIQNSMVSGLRKSAYPTNDLGVKQAPFYVLIGAEMPSVLAEISFISNPKDADRLRQDKYLHEIADQIAAGVVGYVEHQATAALQL